MADELDGAVARTRAQPAPTLRLAAARSAVPTALVGKAAELVTLVLLATLVPRALGPAVYGEFALALTVVTLGSTALTLGGSTLMARFVPSVSKERRPGLARALGMRLARGRGLALGVLAGGAGLLVVADPERFPPGPALAVLTALGLSVAATLALQVGLGLGATGAWSARYGLQNAVLVAGALALGSVAGAAGAIAAIVLASAAALALGVAVVRRPLRAAERGATIPAGALRFGALQGAGGGLTQLVHRGGIVAVAILGGTAVETGYTALAIGLVLPAVYVVSQVFLVTLPERAEERAADPRGAESALRRLAVTALGVLAPLAALAALVAEPAVALLFGESFRGAVPALGPALALVTLAPLAALVVQVAALRLRPQAVAWSALLGAAALAGTAVFAVPAWGASGGALATLVGTAVAALAGAALVRGAARPGFVAATAASTAAVLALAWAT